MIDERDGGAEWLAPVIPISGFSDSAEAVDGRTRQRGSEAGARVSGEPSAEEASLLRKLRARSMSVSEARAVLQPLGIEERDAVIERFIALGYLDDAALAAQLARAGVERKGQGRRAIAQALAARGLHGDAVTAALAELPDDDAERALDFARTRVRRLSRTDRDGDIRRLVGQLSRRGYPSNVAMTAARAALDEREAEGTAG